MTTAPLPHDPQIERAVLSALLQSSSAYDQHSELLHPELFHDPTHRAIYLCIARLRRERKKVDTLTVAQSIGQNIPAVTIAEISMAVSTTIHVDTHIAILTELHIRRRFTYIAHELLNGAQSMDADVSQVSTRVNEQLSSLFRADSSAILSIEQTSAALLERIKENMIRTTPTTGTPTGFPQFDQRTGGLQAGDLTIIAAESSMGKTSFALSIAEHALRHGARIGVYSMEMTHAQLTARLVAMRSGVSSAQILYHPLRAEELGEVDRAIGTLTGAQLYFDDRSTQSLDAILSSCRYLKIRRDVHGVIIDYAQLVRGIHRTESDEAFLARIARECKNIAKELGIWVLLLSQLNRDEKRTEPTGDRLRGSGQIREACDNLLLIHRPEAYQRENILYSGDFSQYDTHHTALIIQDKGRNSGIQKFLCAFHPSTTHFRPLTESEYPPRTIASSNGRREEYTPPF